MNCARVILLSTLLTACAAAPQASSLKSGSGGFIGEHGGDFLHCEPAAGSQFNGDYALDYVVTYDSHTGRDQDPTEATFDALIARTTRLLEQKLPELASSWKAYAALIQSADPAQPRRWHGVGSGLLDLPDEQLSQIGRQFTLDANCKVRDGVPNLRQMVVRSYYIFASSPGVAYDYDQPAFDAAHASNPLQLSYLVVHEWLWDFVGDPRANRAINHLIHSRRIETMTPAEVRNFLLSFSVTTDAVGQVGQPGPQEQTLNHLASEAPFCDASKRIAVPFSQEAPRFQVDPGKTVSLKLVTPSLFDQWPQGICGVAALYSHGLADGVDAEVSVVLRRGGAPVKQSFRVSRGSMGQELLTGFCGDDRCGVRKGDLGFFYRLGEYDKETWNLDVTVSDDSHGSAEISFPYLVFYAVAVP